MPQCVPDVVNMPPCSSNANGQCKLNYCVGSNPQQEFVNACTPASPSTQIEPHTVAHPREAAAREHARSTTCSEFESDTSTVAPASDDAPLLQADRNGQQAKQRAKTKRRSLRRGGTFQILFGNITTLSPKALHFLQYDTSDAILAVETHWSPASDPRGGQIIRKWSSQDRHLVIAPPQNSLTSASGSYGGALASVKRALQFQPLLDSQRLTGIRASAWVSQNPYLVGFQMGLRNGVDLLCFGCYHRDGMQLELLNEVARITRNGALPFLLVGDFNDVRGVVEASGWLQQTFSTVIGPTAATCTSGRCIDYVIASNSILPIVHSVKIDWSIPFSPHAALRITISRDTAKLRELKVVKPKPLPRTFMTHDDSDSDTQRQWATAKDAARRSTMHHSYDERSLQFWCLAMEFWTLARDGVDIHDDSAVRRFVGRCRTPRYIMSFAVERKRGPIATCTVPSGYNAQCRVAAIFHNVAKRLTGRVRSSAWRDALARLLTQQSDLLNYFWNELGSRSGEFLKRTAAIISFDQKLPPWHLSSFVSYADGIEKRMAAASDAAGKQSWRNWVSKALKKGASAAHRFCTIDQKPVEHPPRAISGSFASTQVASDATKEWSTHWHAYRPEAAHSARLAIDQLRQQVLSTGAAQQAAKLFTTQAIRRTARIFPKRTAIGPDGIDFSLIAALPDCLLDDLAHILQAIIGDCKWQQEQLESWMVLLPKRIGGYRTIAIMTSMARICMRILCGDVRVWDKQAAVTGDTAAPQVQPAIAIARRSAASEAAVLLGRKVVRILWDVSKFFDSIPIDRLIDDVKEHGLPIAAACMALQLHTADRRLRIGTGHGELITDIGRSIIAGCSSERAWRGHSC